MRWRLTPYVIGWAALGAMGGTSLASPWGHSAEIFGAVFSALLCAVVAISEESRWNR